MPAYPQRIRKKHLRAQWCNYTGHATYFVTGCTHNRGCHFGKVADGTMVLNDFGRIVMNQWAWLFHQYPYCVNHAFVLMPDHFHGLIEINPARAGTGRDPSLQQVPVKIKSLSELMGAFKTTSSKKIHLAGNVAFKWQRSFHDRIVREPGSFENIRKYILENPQHMNNEDETKNNAIKNNDTLT